MSSDTEHMLALFKQHRYAFDSATTPEGFLANIAGTAGAGYFEKHIQHPHAWTRYLFRQAKAHGLEFSPHRVLYMPEARRAEEIFEDVRYLPLPQGGLYRDQARAMVGNRVFVSGSGRAPKAVPFGHVGGKREWSPEWLNRGDAIRRISGAKSYGTYVRPTKAAREAFACSIGGKIGSFELITWDDGRTLVVAKDDDSGIFSQWLAVLDAGADLSALMPAEDQALIAENKAAELAAWSVEPPRYVVEGEDRALGALGVMSPFREVVRAFTAEEAHARVRNKRNATREHILIKSATLEATSEKE